MGAVVKGIFYWSLFIYGSDKNVELSSLVVLVVANNGIFANFYVFQKYLTFIQINVNIRECWTLIFGTFIIAFFCGSYLLTFNIQVWLNLLIK